MLLLALLVLVLTCYRGSRTGRLLTQNECAHVKGGACDCTNVAYVSCSESIDNGEYCNTCIKYATNPTDPSMSNWVKCINTHHTYACTDYTGDGAPECETCSGQPCGGNAKYYVGADNTACNAKTYTTGKCTITWIKACQQNGSVSCKGG